MARLLFLPCKKHDTEKNTRYAIPGTKGCEIVETLKPREGEYRIVKKRFSAFMQTSGI
jgi:nicotinamidase-related amidase